MQTGNGRCFRLVCEEETIEFFACTDGKMEAPENWRMFEKSSKGAIDADVVSVELGTERRNPIFRTSFGNKEDPAGAYGRYGKISKFIRVEPRQIKFDALEAGDDFTPIEDQLLISERGSAADDLFVRKVDAYKLSADVDSAVRQRVIEPRQIKFRSADYNDLHQTIGKKQRPRQIKFRSVDYDELHESIAKKQRPRQIKFDSIALSDNGW